MNKKRFDYTAYDDGTESIYDRKEDKYYFDMQLSEIEELLNELADENERLKRILNELSNRLQFDVENGIRSYPVKLSEYLSNALKELSK